MLSDTSQATQGAASSTASQPQASRVVAAEQLIEPPPEIDATMVDGDEITGAPPIPQVLETTQVVPAQNPISTPQQTFEPPQFVSPQEIFVPPQSLESPLVPQMVTPHQIVVSPVVTAPPPPVTPSAILGSSQAVAPHQVIIPSIVTTPPSLVVPSPVLESCQPVTLRQVVISSAVTAPPSPDPRPPVLGSLRASPTVTGPSLAAQTAPLHQVDATQKLVSQDRVVGPSLQVTCNPQTTVVHHPSDPTGGVASGNSGDTVTTASAYRPQGKAGTTASTRTRRDSIEGAPDIILSLGRSGYELAPPSPQREDDTDTSTITTNSSPGELVAPSSQQSLEEYLTIPMEDNANTPTTPSADELVVPPSQQPLDIATIPQTITASSNRFFYAPRVIPDYHIDRSDLPSWLLERGRLDYILHVEAGAVWEKLIATWLRQERRLSFGLNKQLVGVKLCRASRSILIACRREQLCRRRRSPKSWGITSSGTTILPRGTRSNCQGLMTRCLSGGRAFSPNGATRMKQPLATRTTTPTFSPVGRREFIF